jgi:hypothetical protein
LICRVLVVLAALVLTNQSYNDRQIMRGVSARMEGAARFVDAGVIVRKVVADPKLGSSLVRGKPLLRVVDERKMGGVIDTQLEHPDIVRESDDPVIWYASSDQWDALFHDDPQLLGQLIYGSEGAGKTRTLAMFHYRMWIRFLGCRYEGGQVAPTLDRNGTVRLEMESMYRPSWGRFASRDEFEGFEMCDGTRIRFRYSHQQSAAKGRPIQGYNWVWCARDELQDQVDAHEDCESRGREAPDGRYYQLATATAKDDSKWRELRDILLASGFWIKRTLSIFRSPFISPLFIAAKKATTSAREFLRRFGDPKTGEVGDLMPELAVYYGWLRTRNLVARPQIARDVTPSVLAGYRSYVRPGAAFTLLAGHDPGVIYNTTEILKLLMFGDVPTWTVVGELQTKQTTAREHARLLAEYVRDSFGVEYAPTRHDPNPGGKLLTFIDPHGKGEAQTDYQSVYMAFQKEGLDAFNPAPMSIRIKRTARVEMMNRLLGGSADSEGVPRLVIATDEQRRAVAPRLVESLESLKKRPGDDDPEGSQTKNEDDKTHAPVATAYALWMFEQEAFTEQTIKTALAEAKRTR